LLTAGRPAGWPALWLHGPDFTRTGVAADLADRGSTVLEARIASELSAEPADTVPADASSVVILSGADNWSTPELAWLLSNAVVHRRRMPARIPLTASTIDGLPALRAALTQLEADIGPVEMPPH
jgi:hypothetical protein